MWNIIKRREGATMFYCTEGDYRLWVIERPTGYEVIINNISTEVVEPVFNKSGYSSFYEATEAAKSALLEIRSA